MDIPDDVPVEETKTSFIWTKDGIIFSITKENAPKLSPEENEQQTKEFLAKYGHKKHLFLIDAKHAQASSPEERKRAANVLNEITTAMAIIVYNPLGRMLINLFVGLQKPPYPLKIFKPGDEVEAINWLKSHVS